MKLWKFTSDSFDYEAHTRALHSESFTWAVACVQSDRNLAEDVLQTVYLKILEGKARFHHQSAFKTWLFSVIKFTAIDMLRKRGKLAEWMESDAEESFEQEVSYDDELIQIRNLIEQLSPKQKMVLQLVFYHDMSIEEASDVMKIALGTARTHYERGKKRMRELMESSPKMKELLR